MKKSSVGFGLVLAFGVGVAVAGDAPVVVVGDGSVTAAEVQERARTRLTAEAAQDPAQRRELLEDLIDEELMLQEARRRGVDHDPKVEKVMINTLLRDQVYGNVKNADFTDATLRAWFDAHRSEFDVPEKRQVRRLLVKVGEGRTDAQARKDIELLRKATLADPEQFGDLCSAHSEDPYKRRGGDVGFVTAEGKPGLDATVVEVAFKLQEDALSEPFRTPEGWNLVRVEARRDPIQRTFEQMKGSVLRKVKSQALDALQEKFVARLRAATPPKVDEAAYKKLVWAGERAPAAPGGLMVPLDDDELDEADGGEGDAPSGD